MRCGESCFQVTLDNVDNQVTVTARSSAEARKKARASYGQDVKILSIKQDRK